MEIKTDKRLFWFLKDGARLDLSRPAILDMYVQQIICSGTEQDVKSLLGNIPIAHFKESFTRISRFLSPEVKMFWEHYLGNH